MALDTDVIIVGAGPTGLMMACQLNRFGVPFRIIDKQVDRSKESRAFGIQAKTMEIFQNLGLDADFLAREAVGREVHFYVNGKERFCLNFTNIAIKDTPFPAIYFLPQSETEEILIEYLKKKNITIERQTSLMSFAEVNDTIEAEVKNDKTGTTERIHSRYIIGCDGAHSIVRDNLAIPFVGATYQQEFVLADVSVKSSIANNYFSAFIRKEGNVLLLPLSKDKTLSRLILIGMDSTLSPSKQIQPTIEEIEAFTRKITGIDIQLSNLVWVSRFYLHHRAVSQYTKGNAFIAGDAAHIHTPVGAQGMNTGLQDVTNLAWKIAFVLKHGTPKSLLETYQTERQRIGKKLVNTTDKIFGMITSKNSLITLMRLYFMPIMLSFLSKSVRFTKCLFHFISELGVRYHKNEFISEITQGADTTFIKGPQAGRRAPDAPTDQSTLFELFRNKPINVLIFQAEPAHSLNGAMTEIEKINPDVIAINRFIKSSAQTILFDRYGVTSSAIYVIRPDGYIGFRVYGNEFDPVVGYLRKLFPA